MATRNITKIKGEMIFNHDLTRIIDAMKGVAAAQYHVVEGKRTPLDLYTRGLEELFKVCDFRSVTHPFIQSASQTKLICVITTDSGFLGGLNLKVVQTAMRQEDDKSHYLVIGERGVSNLRDFNRSLTPFPGVNLDDTRFHLMERVIKAVIEKMTKENFGQVVLVYPYALSFTVQRIQVLNLFPCSLFSKDKPAKISADEKAQAEFVIVESERRAMVEMLGVLWMRKWFTQAFEDSKMAEFGARTMHLEESYQTLMKMNRQLKMEFFKTRREKIDQSLRESFTSQLMCKLEEE